MPLPLIAAAAAAGGFFKWARGAGGGGGGGGSGARPLDLDLSAEELEHNRVLLLRDPEAVVDRALVLRSSRDASQVFDCRCVDYNSDEDEHQLHYTNGQVLWVDLKTREFQLGAPDEGASGESGDEGASTEVPDIAVDLLMHQAAQVENALYYAKASSGGDSSGGAGAGGLRVSLGGRLGGAVATSLARAGLGSYVGDSDSEQGEEMVPMHLDSAMLGRVGADALTELDLSGAGLTAEGSRLLAAPLATNSTITALNLRRNRIGPDGCSLLCGALRQQPSIISLDLGSNQIGAVGLASLAVSLPHCAALTALNLRRNDFGEGGGVLLADMLCRCPTLAHLDLGNNGLTSKVAGAMAGALREGTSCELVSLRFDDNPLGGAGLTHLVKALCPASAPHCHSLTALHARNCAVGPRAGKAVATMLQQPGGNRTITALGLAHNLLGAAGAEALICVLAGDTLERLELQGDAQCEAFLRANVPHLKLVPPTAAAALTAALE